jgi:hypothetical protein
MTSETHRHSASTPERTKGKQLGAEDAAAISTGGILNRIRHHKAVTAVITAGTLAAAGAAVAVDNWLGLSSSGPKPIDTPTSISSATPTEKPSATPTPESTVMPDALVNIQKLTLDQYRALPASEKAAYADWLMNHIQTNDGQTIDLQTFAKNYEAAEPYPGNQNNLVDSDAQSADDDVQKAAAYAVLIQRVALATKGLDANKLAYSAFADPEGVDAENLQTLLTIIKNTQAVGTGNLEDWQQGAKQTLEVENITDSTKTDSTKTEDGFNYTGTNVNGEAASGKLTFIPFTDLETGKAVIDPATGEATGMWVS